jgi:hypothetical protein
MSFAGGCGWQPQRVERDATPENGQELTGILTAGMTITILFL